MHGRDIALSIGVATPAPDLAGLAGTVRTALANATRAGAVMLEHFLTVGDALIAAKDKAGYGNWLTWLRNECDLSEDAAERYMQLARGRAHLDSARVRNLSLTGALRLIKEAEPSRAQQQAPAIRPARNTKGFYAFSDAMAWWAGASIADRRRFINSIGSHGLAEAIPPDWNMRLTRDGDNAGAINAGEIARRDNSSFRPSTVASLRINRAASRAAAPPASSCRRACRWRLLLR
jgi:hypothetical protein